MIRKNRFPGRCCRCDAWVPEGCGTLTADNDIQCQAHSPDGAFGAVGERHGEAVNAKARGERGPRRPRKAKAKREKRQLELFGGADGA